MGGGGGDGGGAAFTVAVIRAASLVAPLLSVTRTSTSLSPAGSSASSALELCDAPRGVSVSAPPALRVTRWNEYVRGKSSARSAKSSARSVQRPYPMARRAASSAALAVSLGAGVTTSRPPLGAELA